MIMIIVLIYFFYLMWYLINSWKLLSENTQASPRTNPLSPLKIQKLPVLPFVNIRNFSAPPFPPSCRIRGRQCVNYLTNNPEKSICTIWCMVPEIWRTTQNFLSFLPIFSPFTQLTTPKIKILKKEKKAPIDIYNHFTLVYHKWHPHNVWFLRYGER